MIKENCSLYSVWSVSLLKAQNNLSVNLSRWSFLFFGSYLYLALNSKYSFLWCCTNNLESTYQNYFRTSNMMLSQVKSKKIFSCFNFVNALLERVSTLSTRTLKKENNIVVNKRSYYSTSEVFFIFGSYFGTIFYLGVREYFLIRLKFHC